MKGKKHADSIVEKVFRRFLDFLSTAEKKKRYSI